MCFSASASYSAAVVLVGTGAYALQQARRLNAPHWQLWALVPVFFGIQQAFEGRVWQMLGTGQPCAAVPYALGFHFFAHFLWPWWIPLASCLVEPRKIRKRIFGGCAVFGVFAGALVISVTFLHPEWMTVGVREHSITYKFDIPYRSDIHLPLKPAAIYALVVLVPLLCSSHRHVRVFGWLVALSSLFTSEVYGYAYISVWCFFAALLSLYIIYMIRQLGVRAAAV